MLGRFDIRYLGNELILKFCPSFKAGIEALVRIIKVRARKMNFI